MELKLVFCRICGGEHYTMHCMYSSFADHVPADKLPTPIAKKYLPPNRRAEGITATTNVAEKISTNCLRVSYLSKQITDTEFFARFTRFGKIIKKFLPRDYATGKYKGYGYVAFLKRESTEKVLEVMDRRGYDNLIMRVAWDERLPPSARLYKSKSDK